ncbi:uncharacterized protein N0V89_012074 [Didymosphaeria variabile]|uniref:Uncharacterized protein n=1 Tax=Didymosphaeria variabile TaxID=1932322 RepID=A0A9W8XBR6_9PLEO|nr:uncharacterized protein N0V89_012074 [Didymosphaeria variabile]KAJ4345938.1 hypothetical protein N0V89_012074 [Didymosphaeria variabile]
MGDSYNVLDGASLQADPRDADSLARLNAYASVLRNYCGAGDPICAGGDNVTQHLDYFDLYTDDAATWVVSKVDAAAALCDAASSSVASSVGATATSSSAGPIAASSTSVVASIATPTGINSTTIAAPTGANASTVAISSITGANATSVVAPIWANSTAASIATPASFALVSDSTAVYPTTIRTVVSANAIQSNSGYAPAYPTTILTIVSVTSTLSEYATVTGAVAPPQETKSNAALPPVAAPAPASKAPAAPKAPKAQEAPSPAPQLSQKPASAPLPVCGPAVITTTVYL